VDEIREGSVKRKLAGGGTGLEKPRKRDKREPHEGEREPGGGDFTKNDRKKNKWESREDVR